MHAVILFAVLLIINTMHVYITLFGKNNACIYLIVNMYMQCTILIREVKNWSPIPPIIFAHANKNDKVKWEKRCPHGDV